MDSQVLLCFSRNKSKPGLLVPAQHREKLPHPCTGGTGGDWVGDSRGRISEGVLRFVSKAGNTWNYGGNNWDVNQPQCW